MTSRLLTAATAMLLVGTALFAGPLDDRVAQHVRTAREAAAADDHRAAIDAFRRAVLIRPALGDDLGKELGLQYTWLEKPDSALVWFDRYIAAHPDDVDARVGRARALAWGDRLDDAIAAFDTVLAEHPEHLEAELARTQAVNWSGRHFEAAAGYENILERHPEQTGVRLALAETYRSMGRPDLAIEVLGTDTPNAESVTNNIAGARRPGVSYSYAGNTDSDDVERRFHTARASSSPSLLTRLEAAWSTGRITQLDYPDVRRNRLTLAWTQRFSNTFSLNATPGIEWNAFDRFGPEAWWQDEFNLFVFDGYLTATPRDWVRMDFGVFVGSLDNPLPIFRGISLSEYSAGLDYRLSPTLLSVSRAAAATFTDGNTRLALGQDVVWRPIYRLPLPWRHRITAQSSAGYMNFASVKQNGYYNPDSYFTLYELVTLDVTFTRAISASVNGRFGFETENGDSGYVVGSFGGSATYRFSSGLSFSAGYYNSKSRLDTRSGYQADGFYLSADYIFAR